MTTTEFIKTYLGKKVDYDKAFDAQCVDLYRQYCHDFGIPHTGAVEGAKDLWFKFSENKEHLYFNRMTVLMAELGDVIIWDATSTNRFGHVAIFIANLEDGEILVFEQNGFKKDGAKFAIRKKDNCLGILKRKNR